MAATTYFKLLQTAWQEGNLDTNRADLLAILALRFGFVPSAVRRQCDDIDNIDTVKELIKVASHTPTWQGFIQKLKECQTAHTAAVYVN